MSINIHDVLSELKELHDKTVPKTTLPSDELIKKYEKKLQISLPPDYKVFLQEASNVFVGYISPYTLHHDLQNEYGELSLGVKEAHTLGVPKEWLPICEDNGDYYCITPNGTIRFWDHNGSNDESWPNLATWIKEVWIDGG